MKTKISTIKEKNRITNNIIDAMLMRKSFLICGHQYPDEDCISSMIAFAILLTKFEKIPQVYIDGYVPETMNYLLDICKYNSIKLINKSSRLQKNIDTIIICDTPKPDNLDINSKIKKLFKTPDVIKIELDHHLGADSDYIGDKDYQLVTEASSTCELIGFLTLKLRNRKDVLKSYLISDPFSRNLVLAITTGIVGDTNMGQYLKSRREKKYYKIFTNTYNDMLMKSTVKESFFHRIEDISNELQKLSMQEETCHGYIINKIKKTDSIGYINLNHNDMKYLYGKFDSEVVVSVVRHIANEVAEEAGKLSIISYYDNFETSNLLQFKVRRSHKYKKFDLRDLLEMFSITNGGGHEGAIGFRFPENEIENVNKFVKNLINKLEEVL